MFAVRHWQCFILFCGITCMYGMRVNLSMAIVAMTDKKSTGQDFQEFKWNEKIKSLLLSSFFWGYLVTQIPGGYLSRRFGGKFVILTSVILSSLAAIVTPFATQIGDWPMLFCIRVLQGLTQGVLFPTTHSILAKWAPKNERAAMGTYTYSGVQFGTVSMLAGSGYLAASPLGWPSIFYIVGALGLVWSVVWFVWGASSPKDHKSISQAERELIQSSIGETEKTETQRSDRHISVPWVQIFKSPPFYALAFAHSSYSWCHWTMLAEIPAYMKNILKMNIKSNALLTALPYLIMLFLGVSFASLASFVARRKLLTLAQSRKIFNTIGTWIPSVCLVWLGFLNSDHTSLAVVLMTMAVSINAAIHLGFQINHIDLSPNFAGILLALTNSSANVMSIFAPLLVGFVVTDEANPGQWQIVFAVAAVIGFVGNLIFIIFGKFEVQPWNAVQATKTELEPMNKSTSNVIK